MTETNDELIRKGNALIAAARDGKVGFLEGEIRLLQSSYVATKKKGWVTTWIGPVLVFVAGLFFFTSGIILDRPIAQMQTEANLAEAISGVPSHSESLDHESDQTGGMIATGACAIFGSLAYAFLLKKAKSKSKKYVDFVEQEYPKLPNRDAA